MDKKLLKKWNKILKDEGFKDIEFTNRDGQICGYLKDSHIATNFKPDTEDYYILARRYLWNGVFESPTDKAVWKAHSEGLSYDKILKQFGTWTSRSPIARIILKHKEIMLNAAVHTDTD